MNGRSGREGGDERDDARESELREIEALVALTQERTSRSLDVRVARGLALSAGIAGVVAEIEAGTTRRARSWKRVAIAAGFVVAVGVAVGPVGRELGWIGVATERNEIARHENVPSQHETAPLPSPTNSNASSDISGQRRPERLPSPPTDSTVATNHDGRPGAPVVASAPLVDRLERSVDSTAGPRTSLDANETIERADAIVRLRADGSAMWRRPEDRLACTVTRVYHGDRALTGAPIELLRGNDERNRCFLAWDEQALQPQVPDRGFREFIVCIRELQDERARNGDRVFRIALAKDWEITLVTDGLPTDEPATSDRDVATQLASDLAASLSDRRRAVRRSAITALRHFDDDSGGETIPARFWQDPAIARSLLDATEDVDPTVRFHAVALDPGLAGDAGMSSLLALLFDPIPVTRRSAEAALARHGFAELVAPLSELHDDVLERRWSWRVIPPSIKLTSGQNVARAVEVISSHDDPAMRVAYVVAAGAWADRQPSASGSELILALQQALQDPDVDVRIAAAEVASSMPEGSMLDALTVASADAEPRVRAMAAISRASQGDGNSIMTLREIFAGSDVRAAAASIERIIEVVRSGGLERDQLVGLLFDGVAFRDTGVRCRALTMLAQNCFLLRPEQLDRFRQCLVAVGTGAAPLEAVAAARARMILERFDSLTPAERRLAKQTARFAEVGAKHADDPDDLRDR
jgi:HEAT repeat protein